MGMGSKHSLVVLIGVACFDADMPTKYHFLAIKVMKQTSYDQTQHMDLPQAACLKQIFPNLSDEE